MNRIDFFILKSVDNYFIRLRTLELFDPLEVPMWEGDPRIRFLGDEIKVIVLYTSQRPP